MRRSPEWAAPKYISAEYHDSVFIVTGNVVGFRKVGVFLRVTGENREFRRRKWLKSAFDLGLMGATIVT
jgi:hypothetical protein